MVAFPQISLAQMDVSQDAIWEASCSMSFPLRLNPVTRYIRPTVLATEGPMKFRRTTLMKLALTDNESQLPEHETALKNKKTQSCFPDPVSTTFSKAVRTAGHHMIRET